jgi:hypothetical protein
VPLIGVVPDGRRPGRERPVTGLRRATDAGRAPIPKASHQQAVTAAEYQARTARAAPGSAADIARRMTETDLQDRIIAICKRLGLDVYHTHDSRRSEAGFPDLVIAGDYGHLFAELKRQDRHPTAPQQAWLDRLAKTGTAVVWRPSDLIDGSIAWALAKLAHGDRIPAGADR